MIEVFEVDDTELSQQQGVVLMNTVTAIKEMTKPYIGHNDLSLLDPGIMAKAVTMLVEMDLQNTKLAHEISMAMIYALTE